MDELSQKLVELLDIATENAPWAAERLIAYLQINVVTEAVAWSAAFLIVSILGEKGMRRVYNQYRKEKEKDSYTNWCEISVIYGLCWVVLSGILLLIAWTSLTKLPGLLFEPAGYIINRLL